MTIRWPTEVLQPIDVAFDVVPRSLSAPSSVSGLGQVVASDAGIWKARFGQVVVRNRAQILTHRALSVLLEGRLNPILVPLCRAWQPTPEGVDASGASDILNGVPHSDLSPFSDGSLYVGGTLNSIRPTGDTPARATTINVLVEFGGRIEPGQHFSIGERLYRIRTVTYTTPTTAAITFRPPLREAADATTYLNFDDPICRMKLADDEGLNLELARHKYATPSVDFVEDL